MRMLTCMRITRFSSSFLLALCLHASNVVMRPLYQYSSYHLHTGVTLVIWSFSFILALGCTVIQMTRWADGLARLF